MAKEASGNDFERAPRSPRDEQEMVNAMKKTLTGKSISFSGASTGPSSSDGLKRSVDSKSCSTTLNVKKGRRKRGK